MPTIPSMVDCRSGAVGDVIYARNAYGPYQRPNSPVTDPVTALQLTVRSVFANLVDDWRTALTPQQRDAWLAYSLRRPLRDACPPERYRTAQGEFLHANLARVRAGLRRVDTPPTPTERPQLGEVAITQSTTTDTALVHASLGDYANDNQAAIIIYVSAPLPLTRFFHRTPHQFAYAIRGNPSTPPSFPYEINLPHGVSAQSNLNFKTILVTPDGRVSDPTYHTYFWDTPPAPVATYTSAGPTIIIEFDKPLDAAVTGYKYNVIPRNYPRTSTTVWRFLAGFSLYIDPSTPSYLYVYSNGSTQIITSTPAVGYTHYGAPFLKHATLPLIVQPFTLPIPYP